MGIINELSYNLNEAIPVVIESGGGNAPTHCTDFAGSYVDGKLSYTWKDHDCNFYGGTRLVIKEGSYPEDENDGTIIKDFYVPNEHETTPAEIEVAAPTATTTYYAILFPFGAGGAVNKCKVSRVSIEVTV